jgi:general secretion pathway protein A
MYLDFYKLHLKPFSISTDPKFLWLGEKHKEALAVLKYGILDNKGFLLLTGDVGTGKTTLLNALLDSLGDDVLVALVTDPGLAKMDFFNFVADSFEMDRNFKSKGEFLIYLKNYLLDVHRQNKQTLLIIDECQHLNQKLLEEVRLLSNIEKFNTKLINIFFVGQSEFNDIILRPRNRAIRQRITINYNISALSEQETDKYIRFRLNVAGSKEAIFTARAIKAVYKFSNGYPRLINIICDQALLTGYVKEKRKIDEKIVSECANELKIPYGTSRKKSMATPEAADEKPAASSLAPIVSAGPADLGNRQFSRPLVIAFIVVLVIWISLVAIFVINQQRPVAMDRTEDLPGASDIAANQKKQNGMANQTDATGDGHQPTTGLNNNSAGKGQPLEPALASKAFKKNTTSPLIAGDASSSAPPGVTPNLGKENPASSSDSTSEKGISLKDIKSKFGAYPEVRFGFNSNQLDRESYDILGLIARYCIQNPETTVILRGYTDSSGVRAYNLKLSEFRADMVKTYLVGRGVKESAIKSIAMGPGASGPAGEDSSDGDSQRKVVIEIIPANG